VLGTSVVVGLGSRGVSFGRGVAQRAQGGGKSLGSYSPEAIFDASFCVDSMTLHRSDASRSGSSGHGVSVLPTLGASICVWREHVVFYKC